MNGNEIVAIVSLIVALIIAMIFGGLVLVAITWGKNFRGHMKSSVADIGVDLDETKRSRK